MAFAVRSRHLRTLTAGYGRDRRAIGVGMYGNSCFFCKPRLTCLAAIYLLAGNTLVPKSFEIVSVCDDDVRVR